ncbi:MAG TPA: S53 family peptidase [Solirubrobacteraceae bacterium]|nr:S53 family peptidase [Solirubrobacteraceae bacterium]
MRKTIGSGVIAVVGAASAIAAALAIAAPGALAATGPRAGTTRVGAAPAGQQLTLDLPLKTDTAGLARFAAAVSDPSSPQYGNYEPVSMLAQRFGASAAVRRHVVSYLRSVGARDVSIDVTGQFADATMPVATAEHVFGTGISAFRTDTVSGVQRFVAPDTAARIPPALAGSVTGVVGLDTEPFQQPEPTPVPASERSALAAQGVRGVLARWASGSAFRSGATSDANFGSGYAPRSGTPSGCQPALAQPNGFTPNQYEFAYNIGVNPAVAGRGKGERVALIEIDGFKRSDIRTFAACFGLPIGPIKIFHVGTRHNLKPSFETTLDLEMLLASAPGVFSRRVGVYQARATGATVLRALTAPLRKPKNRPDVISASLGICEPGLVRTRSVGRSGADAFNRTLEVAAANGVSVLSSAGDAGSTACVNPRSRVGKPFKIKAVSFPASSPWVTAVGGTNFLLNGANQILGQRVWNNSPALPDAGGGGYSRLFHRPGYQHGVTHAHHRVVPDVALLADPYPGYLIYCSARPGCVNHSNRSPWTPFGGTSAGSPLLAGSFALVDSELRTHGRPNLGFANPLLYRIHRSRLRRAVFRDVRTGNNDVFPGRGVGCCSARRGFDPASGLGSINVGALMIAAIADTHRYAHLKVHLPRQRHVLRARYLRVHVHCSRACLVIAYTHIRIKHHKGVIKARSRLHVLHHRAGRTIRIALSRGRRHKIAKALHHHQRVTAYVRAAIVDPTGKVEHHTHARKLRIRR